MSGGMEWREGRSEGKVREGRREETKREEGERKGRRKR